LLRFARQRAREVEWRIAIQEIREAVHDLWAALPMEQRRRFLRHLRPWWDAHRHRIAPVAAHRICALADEGRFHAIAGRVISARPSLTGARVSYRPRGESETVQIEVARIVNCTGPELDIERAREPLLDSLMASGRIRSDACRLGIDVDRRCRTLGREGRPSGLYALGPITRGAFWESVAVSDIAVRAEAIADQLSARSRF
jgi:uncharacterized NAD(P)/FAD-binding protein YdhS